MRIKPFIATMLLGALFAAPLPAQNATNQTPREFPSSCEAFCDLVLTIQNKQTETDGTLALQLAALYKHEPVALRITLAPGIVAGFMNLQTGMPDLRSVARGGIHFQRTGPESDRLVMALAKLYQSRTRPIAMDDDIHFDVYAAEGNPGNLQTKEVVFRIFHTAPDTDGHEVELLLNINLPKNEVRIRETNQDFREYILQILSRQKV